eukprot:5940148-Amphidinium_carterae.1
MLDDVGVLVEVEDVNVNLVLAVLGVVIGVNVSTLAQAQLVLVEVWEVDVHLVVKLVVLDVEVDDEMLEFEDALVDVDVVEQVVLGSDVPELVDAGFVGNVDVLEEVLDDVGVLVEVGDVNVNLVLAVLGVVIGVHVSTLTLALLVLVEVWEVMCILSWN